MGGSFAALRGDGSVVTWGSAAYGGHSTDVRDQLKNVQQIQASRSGFAARNWRWMRRDLGQCSGWR